MPSRADVVSAARSWIDTPWRHQGRLRGVGVDCIGLAVGVARELGYAVADRTDYPRRPDGAELLAALELHLEPLDAPEPGCVVLFEIDGQPQHVGIVSDLAGGLGLIHAFAGARRVVEQAYSPTWPGPAVGFWRLPEVVR